MADKPDESDRLPPVPPTVPDEAFRKLIASRTRQSFWLAKYMASHEWGRPHFTRPLLGEIFHQATELEEVLDAYGARYNSRWGPFRSTVAAAKLFANVNYELLHIQHSVPRYRLLEIEGNFEAETEDAIGFTGEILLRIARRYLEQAEGLGLALPSEEDCEGDFQERLPPGRLERDHEIRRDTDAARTVTRLATEFLKQAAESELLHLPSTLGPEEYRDAIPESISEARLRDLQHQFHSLQSTYDTFVSDTDTEQSNPELPVLRGHVSVIYHLLLTAESFAHYYERHVMAQAARTEGIEPCVDETELLSFLMKYSVDYAGRYLQRARQLCQDMLRQYAEEGEITVGGPRYRGFHMRPSTLIAKIVLHYGSKVQLKLADGTTYDASSPMDIFRANHTLIANKRRWLLRHMGDLPCVKERGFLDDPVRAVRRVVLTLSEQGEVVIYERPLPIRPPEKDDKPGDLMSYVYKEVGRLQTTGVIDIDAEIPVAFVGDKRVLNDLKLLAEHGYGEDNFGKNIPLPSQLSYLRR
jgi:hypothetical protein